MVDRGNMSEIWARANEGRRGYDPLSFRVGFGSLPTCRMGRCWVGSGGMGTIDSEEDSTGGRGGVGVDGGHFPAEGEKKKSFTKRESLISLYLSSISFSPTLSNFFFH